MELRVSNSDVEGHVDAPPSKSYTHRAVLAGGLADETRVVNPLRSADTRASVRCAKGLGAEITDDEGDLVVEGVEGEPEVPDDVLNCANSGTTLRLFAGASSLADGTTVLTGDSSLRERPNGPLLDALERLGGRANSTRSNGRAPLVVEGRIDGGEVSIDGTVSSQFISSLLLATPPTEEGARIEVVGGLKSRPYVEITLEVLDSFGVECEEDGEEFRLGGGQEYSVEGGEYRVPGDFSSASYPLAAGGVAGGEVEVGNLYPSAQGDSVIVDVLDRMGADVSWDRESGVVTVSGGDLVSTEFDASDNPDLVPTVAVLGAVAEGETEILDAEHLRFKETDRLEATATELGKMGVEIEEGDDYLIVDGDSTRLKGGRVDGRHDHRIVMALATAALVAEGDTVIETAESVEISYPGFVDDLKRLGADVETDG